MRTTLLVGLFAPLCVAAQTPLPYTTGFDNAAQQAGWQEYRTGYLSNYSWGMNTLEPPSAPNRLWHDYVVGGNESDTVRDWWVSPAFEFSAGAVFTCKVNVFAIMGSAQPADACTIMLLAGSADPTLATVTPLMDLLPLVTNTGTYTQLPPVSIPPTTGSAHIAFYHQATQNWLTPGIDDVSITAAPVGIADVHGDEIGMHVFPNPVDGTMTFQLPHGLPVGTLRITTLDGRTVVHERASSTVDVDHLAPGLYIVGLRSDTGVLYQARIVKR